MDFEACEAFRTTIDHDGPECAHCGHLAEDHAPADARVTRLRRRRPVASPAPARKAS
jgi:hypothetical protein